MWRTSCGPQILKGVMDPRWKVDAKKSPKPPNSGGNHAILGRSWRGSNTQKKLTRRKWERTTFNWFVSWYHSLRNPLQRTFWTASPSGGIYGRFIRNCNSWEGSLNILFHRIHWTGTHNIYLHLPLKRSVYNHHSKLQQLKRKNHFDMDVSENSGFSPQIIHFDRVFHDKPSILGYCTTIFGNTHMTKNKELFNSLQVEWPANSVAWAWAANASCWRHVGHVVGVVVGSILLRGYWGILGVNFFSWVHPRSFT